MRDVFIDGGRSGTLVNMPRRSRSVVRSRKKRSTMFSRLAVDLAQEFQPLDVRVPVLTSADDLSIQHIQRREQRGEPAASARLLVR